ncbi:MAG: reprolysin-like metallopeptidase [Bacteroidota bacterium]
MTRLCTLLFTLFAVPAFAQPTLWVEAPASEAPIRTDLTDYRTVRIDVAAMSSALADQATARAPFTMRLPMPEGGAHEVTMKEAPVLAPGLQARYPEIRTYVVQGPANGRLSLTPEGLSGLLYDAAGTLVIEPLGAPVTRQAQHHAVFRSSAMRIPDIVMQSITDDVLLVDDVPPKASSRSAASFGETLRTYRLAVTVRGEYTQRRARGSASRALAFIAASVNRVNAIFERDMAIRFELVENNDLLVYDDPDTDPYTTTGGDLLDQAQTNIDAIIGDENYDLGHLISFDEGGGLADLGVICVSGLKSFGYSGVGNETTPFDLLVFPHELGHQLGAPHAFVQPSSDFDPAFFGVEPGPGYTIMSYPHFATYRRVDEQVGYHFHGASIEFMNRYVRGPQGDCGTETPIDNDIPVVTAETVVTIPPGAFLTLESEATDNSSTTLTYAWEQMDTYGDGTGAIPLVRAFDPNPSSSRIVPDFDRFLIDRPLRDEEPLEAGITYRFQVTVRDNLGGGGAQSVAQTSVRVIDSDELFEITSVGEDVVYAPGEPVEVTWNVAGSDDAEAGAASVDVMVSTDNGETWEPVAENVANDGTETVTMPLTPTDEGRLMVRAVGAPFFTATAETFEISGVVSAEDGATPESVTVSSVWPNPTATEARVQVRLTEPSSVRATVYDALGRTVTVVENRSAFGTITMPFDMSGLSAGVYLVRVESEAFVETRRFVVAR